MSWLVLTGYMGVGKSTVGPRVATALGRRFADADEEIVARAGMPIPEIFSSKGELWFRRTEERVIRELLAEPPGVLGLGGGALESERTRGLLGRAASVAWLELDPESAWERVSGTDRPLATDRERFLRRYRRREPAYRESADLTVDASAPVDRVVEEIVAWASGPLGAEVRR